VASNEDEKTDGGVGKLFERKARLSAALVAQKLLIGLFYFDLEHVFDQVREIPVAFRRFETVTTTAIGSGGVRHQYEHATAIFEFTAFDQRSSLKA